MAQIKNLSREAVTLPTGHTIARESELSTTNEVLRSADNVRTIGTLVGSGVLTVEYDADPVIETTPATASIISAPDKKPAPQQPLTSTDWAIAPVDHDKEH